MDKARFNMGVKMVGLIDAAEAYCEAHSRLYDSAIGDDGYCGPEMADILRSLISLLSGEIGAQDGGTLDKRIRTIAAEHNLLNKNGDIES